MHTFGKKLTLTSFGESHGVAIGGVIDGLPAGLKIDVEFIQSELDKRRPGQSSFTTARDEADKIEIFSGVFDGMSTGAPIGFAIFNNNQKSNDYENLREILASTTKSLDIVKYCLPECYKTELTWSINARSLQNFISLRSSKSALWEIRNLANAIYNALPNEHKFIFEKCLPEDEQN